MSCSTFKFLKRKAVADVLFLEDMLGVFIVKKAIFLPLRKHQNTKVL